MSMFFIEEVITFIENILYIINPKIDCIKLYYNLIY